MATWRARQPLVRREREAGATNLALANDNRVVCEGEEEKKKKEL